jgi:predicted O-linked N-acetylglucosamine transferase (SPINDLY family)
MGVPVVTLAGERHAARVGVSLLGAMGLDALIAQDAAAYAETAVALANDLERLARLRAGLRQRMQESPLCDATGVTQELEAAYREMWQTWCTKEANETRTQ